MRAIESSNLDLLLAALPSRSSLEEGPFPLLKVARLLTDFLSTEDYLRVKNVLRQTRLWSHRVHPLKFNSSQTSDEPVADFYIQLSQRMFENLNDGEVDIPLKPMKESYSSGNFAYAERLFDNYRIAQLQNYADVSVDIFEKLLVYVIQLRLYYRANTLQESASIYHWHNLLELSKSRISEKIEALTAEEL